MATGQKTGGRKKGTPNRMTASLADAIDKAFEQAGGAEYLVTVARDDPKTFCALLGKRLPKDITHNVSTSLLELIEQAVKRD